MRRRDHFGGCLRGRERAGKLVPLRTCGGPFVSTSRSLSKRKLLPLSQSGLCRVEVLGWRLQKGPWGAQIPADCRDLCVIRKVSEDEKRRTGGNVTHVARVIDLCLLWDTHIRAVPHCASSVVEYRVVRSLEVFVLRRRVWDG